MPPKTERGYRCRECGWTTVAFVGRCGECQAWNTLDQFASAQRPAAGGARRGAAVPARLLPLESVADDAGERTLTEIPELDRVLGGGLVAGALVLVGGEPGIGKSTLMLQAAARMAARGERVVYVCGEESARQVKLRATRLGITGEGISLVPETNLDAALAAAEGMGAAAVIIDSIQSVFVEGLETRAGGPAQLAEAGARLVAWSKGNEVATIVTGHVTKGGDIAGPRLLEHLVDAVLYFEGAEGGELRILRAVKNRFGATDEVGVFEMTGEGLRSVQNPSAALLASHDDSASGCAVTAIVEGSRPLALEVQALAVPSPLASPRRIASGLDVSRLHLLLAVLARRGGFNAANLDVVATVSGGLRLRDSGADLAVAIALASAIQDQPVERGTAFLGEVALSGAIRPAQQAARRIAELQRLGFNRFICPKATPESAGVTIIPIRTLAEALEAANLKPTRR